MNLYYVLTPDSRIAIVAARNEAECRSIPPYSNWRDMMSFGSWDESEGRKLRVHCLAEDVDVQGEPGVLMAGGAGFLDLKSGRIKP